MFVFSQLVAMGMIIKWQIATLTQKSLKEMENGQDRNVLIAEHRGLIIGRKGRVQSNTGCIPV